MRPTSQRSSNCEYMASNDLYGNSSALMEFLPRFLSKNYLTSYEGAYPTMKYLYVP